MNVSLTPRLVELVHEKVEAGLYTSASEVIREGLRLLEERDQLRAARLERLRGEIAVGLEQADRGELVGAQELFSHLRARFDSPEQGDT